ncbi:hypothetical protein U1701_17375 [Sphingomonas sp. PB2P19]|uniref:hypothetical protein n=1 Tax=Sphingomonas rhamnosi TaxID=3096156 RepID=UPI002FC8966C
MSNMIPIRPLLAAAVVLVAACERPPATAQRQTSENAAVNSDAASSSAELKTAKPSLTGRSPVEPAASVTPTINQASTGQIDSEPKAAPPGRVVETIDITVNGEPACALTVRYRHKVDQPATWRGERCADISVRLVSLKDLVNLGQAAKLDADAREDLARTDGGRAIYVEGKFSSALFPLNVLGRIYKVPLAD